jgi:hypothetical protein
LTDRVNELIARVVKAKADSMSRDPKMKDNRRILFIDYNDKFEGHRICEPGVHEPLLRGNNNFFFMNKFSSERWLGTDHDLHPSGKVVPNIPLDQFLVQADGNPKLPDAAWCREIYDRGIQNQLDWGLQAGCRMAMGIDSTRQIHPEDPSVKFACVPNIHMSHAIMKRILHPKSWGHSKIVEKIMDIIFSNPWY